MKRFWKLGIFGIIAFATIAFAADKYITSSGDVVIKTATSKKVNLQDTLYTTQAGLVGIGKIPTTKLDVNGAISVAGDITVATGNTLKVDTITNTAGTGTPPGIVPIGGMIAVVPALDTANSWQPPATGVCKDGFMRADGATVPGTGACVGSPLVGRTLPNMGLTAGSVNRYPRGSAATSWATGTYTTGGANTVTIGSANLPTHTHLAGTLSVDINHDHGAVNSGTEAGAAASYGVVYAHNSVTWSAISRTGTAAPSLWATGFPGGENSTHYHSVDLPALGSVVKAVSNSTADGGFANTALNNEASYLEVVYVIRVK